MTKMKSKKMTKSTFAIIIMAVVMVALLAFGGTYAYFTATANPDTGSVQTGKVALVDSTDTNSKLQKVMTKSVLPGEEVLKAATFALSNQGTTVRSYAFVEIEALVNDTVLYAKTGDSTGVKIVSVSVAGSDWQQHAEGVYYYVSDAATDANKLPTLTITVEFSDAVQANNDQTAGEKHNLYEDQTCSKAYTGKIMDVPVVINLNSFSIQESGYTTADGYETADAARAAAYTAAKATLASRNIA